ncbi:hypothetical protein ACJIZ3_023372 [Penstemon smallii]|uniref:Myb/SANT-like domain-containing protein n=1 Tax=Penstemon smallii TaxID=265156 RepID=A0ABD3TQ86_9LAMI
MPKTRRMRSEANKINDRWSHEENTRFIDLLLEEAKAGNCNDVATLTASCHRIQAAMNSQFPRRFSLPTVKKKVEWLRHMNKVFDKFLHTPGLVAIFDDHEVATLPKDMTGSPEWPIHIRDDSDDEMAVVPYAETGSSVPALPILLFDSGSTLSDVD